MIPIYKPYLSKYKKSCIQAINDEWVSNHGIYVDLASDILCKILNVKFCILMNNGTSATHCLFKALKFKYPSINKIYVPNHVFIAPINCALQEYTPDQIEIMKFDEKTFNIDTSEEYIKSLEKNSAIIIVHNIGNIINVPRLKRIRPDLIFVEDNCEGLFGKYENILSGTSKDTLCSAVSFYGNKILTTGEGGAFFTNDYDVYKYIKTFYSHGMSDKRYIHSIQGTNYRMTNVQAALLYDQLNDLEHILTLKKQIFINYKNLLGSLQTQGKVEFIQKEEHTESAPWMFACIVKNINYQDMEKYFLEKNIQIRPCFYDMREHNYLKHLKTHESTFFDITSECVMFPSYPQLTLEEQTYIIKVLTDYLI
jgi:perosamine synthetase